MIMAAKAERSVANVIALFGTQPEVEEEEVPVGVALKGNASPRATASTASGLPDLTGKPKVWLTIGRGKTGKTTLIRFLVEETMGAGRQVLIADVDRTNATLTSYFEGVQRPPEGDESSVSAWLETLLTFAMAQKLSAYIDLGGGDTTLRRLVSEVRDLVAMLEASGITVVAAYLLGPQTDDLSPLATLEAAGFQPAATALVLNEGLVESSLPREDAFARVLRHSAFRAAVARGAVPLWMPRLLPAGEIEARRVMFGQAAIGTVPTGRRQTPLGPFDQGRTRAWLDTMRAELAPVQSWTA
jgi:hypothetical protein